MKRIGDVVIGFVCLIIALPIFVLATLAVAFTSRGPVFYRQLRVGRAGRPFKLVKFRTMKVGGDRFSRLTPVGDPRITGVGRFLRSSNIDELPQLVNVLRGDMSIVGPRPEVPEFVDLGNPIWKEVLTVRPGMTSPGTLTFRRQGLLLAKHPDYVDFYRRALLPRKLELAAQYVRDQTLWLDLRIIGATAWHVLSRIVRPERDPDRYPG